MEAAAPTQPQKAKATLTSYVVLSCYEKKWTEFATVEAHSARAAVLDVITNVADDNDTKRTTLFVAVPARSWQPLTVRTETRTVTRIEAA